MKQLLRTSSKLPQENGNLSQKLEDNNNKPTPKRSLKKWIYLGLGIVTCITIIWALQPKPIAVDMALVERGELKVTVNTEGKTRVRDRYTISADVAGRLERVQFKEGDPVKAGSIRFPSIPPFNKPRHN
jgi:HlyD family secretion protein